MVLRQSFHLLGLAGSPDFEVPVQEVSYLAHLGCEHLRLESLLHAQRVGTVALALDLVQEVRSVLLELRVLEHLVGAPITLPLVEVVHVELSDEAREVVVSEVLWKDLVGELFLVEDLEGETVLSPAYGLLYSVLGLV